MDNTDEDELERLSKEALQHGGFREQLKPILQRFEGYRRHQNVNLDVGENDFVTLWQACMDEDLVRVNQFLQEYKQGGEQLKRIVRGVDRVHGISPLHVAIEKGCNGIAQSLINKGATFNDKSQDGKNCLCFAMKAHKNYNVFIPKILEDFPEQLNMSPLALVQGLEDNNLPAVEYLLDRYTPNISTLLNENKNILHLLLECDGDNPDVMKKIMKNLKENDTRVFLAGDNVEGYSPIKSAIHSGKWGSAIILAKEMNRLDHENHGRILNDLLKSAIKNGTDRIIEIVQVCRNEDIIPDGGMLVNALMMMNSYANSERLFENMLQMGLKFEDCNENGVSIIHVIAAECDGTLLKNLLDCHIAKIYDVVDAKCLRYELNDRCLEMCTPLHIAAFLQKKVMVQELMYAGASVNQIDRAGKRPEDLVRENMGNIEANEIIKLLQQKNTDQMLKSLKKGLRYVEDATCLKDRFGRSQLHYAVAGNDISDVRKWISEGCTVNERDDKGITPLVLAIKNGNIQIMQLLILMGALESDRNRIIHIIAFYGQKEMLNHEDIKKIEDVQNLHILGDSFMHEGIEIPECPPLHIACYKNKPSIVKKLISLGASWDDEDINLLSAKTLVDKLFQNGKEIYRHIHDILHDIDDTGRGPLHRAIESGRTEKVATALKKKCYWELCDNDGFSPLALAVKKAKENYDNSHSRNILQLIICAGANVDGIWHLLAFYGSINIFCFVKDLYVQNPDLFPKITNIYELNEKFYKTSVLEAPEGFGNCSALYVACLAGEEGLVKEIIKLAEKSNIQFIDDDFKLQIKEKSRHVKETCSEKFARIHYIIYSGEIGIALQDEAIQYEDKRNFLFEAIARLTETLNESQKNQFAVLENYFKQQIERLEAINNSRLTPKSYVTDVIFSQLFLDAAKKISEHEVGSKKAWKVLFEEFLCENIEPTFKYQESELIANNAKSDTDAALVCLFYWRAFHCQGYVDAEKFKELCSKFSKIGLPNLSQELEERKNRYKKQWMRYDDADMCLTDKMLMNIAEKLSGKDEMYKLALLLGFSDVDFKNMLPDPTALEQRSGILIKWQQREGGEKVAKVATLASA